MRNEVTAVVDVIRPDAGAWADVPLRGRARWAGVVPWLIVVLTVAGSFIADRAWETLDDDAWTGAYRAVDLFGLLSLSVAGIFVLIGWALHRRAIIAAPLVLCLAAVPHTIEGYDSAVVFWAGVALLGVWAARALLASARHLRLIGEIAGFARTNRPLLLGALALESVRGARKSRVRRAVITSGGAVLAWLATTIVFFFELGYTYAELDYVSVSDVIGTGAAALTIAAIIFWGEVLWANHSSRAVGGDLVWDVPANTGPITAFPASSWFIHPGGLGKSEDVAGCICREEHLRTEPEDEDLPLQEQEVLYSSYCPLHGIDRVNNLSPEEFRTLLDRRWLWDFRSPRPTKISDEPSRALVLGFAGRAFPGIPLVTEGRLADTITPNAEAAEERFDTGGKNHSHPAEGYLQWWSFGLRPHHGVLDYIDLEPAGYKGCAIRYRHDRAWYSEEASPPDSYEPQKH
ncbi:hypothetical protein [Arthrobacter sp. Ld5]|uniref:hypothetical protein n=1 Tax=Arthrobacter sp. Ld5 TaxID=649152 RepID=UPI003EB808CB